MSLRDNLVNEGYKLIDSRGNDDYLLLKTTSSNGKKKIHPKSLVSGMFYIN